MDKARLQASVVVDVVTERTLEEARDLLKFRGSPVDKDTPFVVKSIKVPGDKSGTEVEKPVIVFRWTV